MVKTVDVGNEFHYRLANRDKNQGDGKHTAVEFRKRYLDEIDNNDFWSAPRKFIVFDFVNVKKIGPSFANEAFAYFTKYIDPKKILEAIEFRNTTKVQNAIILEELESGYKGK